MSTEREQIERDIALAFEGQGEAWPGGDHLAYVASLAVERRLAEVKATARAEERERIAQAIEEHDAMAGNMHPDDAFGQGLRTAAHVARSTP